jgi:hypothetical protein
MRYALVALALVVAAACSKINEENFGKVRDGMGEQEVLSLLGTPTESSSVSVLGVSGTASKWVAKDAVITVQFVNGKVRGKSFDRAPIK